MITPVTLENQSAPPKPATLELQSGAAVRSSDLVGPCPLLLNRLHLSAIGPAWSLRLDGSKERTWRLLPKQQPSLEGADIG